MVVASFSLNISTFSFFFASSTTNSIPHILCARTRFCVSIHLSRAYVVRLRAIRTHSAARVALTKRDDRNGTHTKTKAKCRHIHAAYDVRHPPPSEWWYVVDNERKKKKRKKIPTQCLIRLTSIFLSLHVSFFFFIRCVLSVCLCANVCLCIAHDVMQKRKRRKNTAPEQNRKKIKIISK